MKALKRTITLLIWMAGTSAVVHAGDPITVELLANGAESLTIPSESHVVLTWTTTGDPNKCRAVGSGWSGGKDATAGEERSKFLIEPTTFEIQCRGNGVSANDSVSVNIATRSLEGSVSPTGGDVCDPVVEGECFRHEFEVECNGLAPRPVNVWEFDPTSQPVLGAVVFAVGGEGKGLYGQDNEARFATVQRLRDEGFQVFSVGWDGETGWQVRGAGLSEPLCGYSHIVRWIHDFLADNPTTMCAQGNSGGATQIAYAIELYGLGDILDMVIVTAGPNYSRMDDFCFNPDYPAYGGPGKGDNIDFFNGWEQWAYCKSSVGEDWQARVLDKQSLLSDLQPRSLDYPGTKVNSIVSEGDSNWGRMSVWLDAITSEKASYFITGDAHGVDKTPEGAAKVRELMIAECVD